MKKGEIIEMVTKWSGKTDGKKLKTDDGREMRKRRMKEG